MLEKVLCLWRAMVGELKELNKKKSINKRIFYWGSKPLGYKCFKYLLDVINKEYNDIEIIGVCISEKDIKKDGVKGQNISEIAKKNKIAVFTEREQLALKGDLGICVGYPHKISLETIRKYKNGIINLHFAPLPYYRGSKTLSHAILNGEKKYGLSLHYIDESLDTGPIIMVKWCKLPADKTAEEITRGLEKLAFDLFRSYLHRMLSERLSSIPQEVVIKQKNIKPTFCTRGSIDKLYRISLNWSFEKICRTVRALSLDKKIPYIEKDGEKIFLVYDKLM